MADNQPAQGALTSHKTQSVHRCEYHATMSAKYDEVLFKADRHITTDQSIEKVEIDVLFLWKRPQANTRQTTDLMHFSKQQVHVQRHSAYLAANDLALSDSKTARPARNALSTLPSFKTSDALAAAIPLAATPQHLAMYNSRAHRTLKILGLELHPGKV